YDRDDNPIQKVVGPAGVAGAGTNTYTYDRADRLASWTNPASTLTNYGWDASGNLVSAGSRTAVYNERDQLISETAGTTTTALSYSARGDLATRQTTVSGVPTTSATQTFDAFDRLTSDGTQVYSYDSADRLVSAGSSVFSYAGQEKEPTSD